MNPTTLQRRSFNIRESGEITIIDFVDKKITENLFSLFDGVGQKRNHFEFYQC